MSETKNLVQGLHEEITRAREIKKLYDEIPTGAFGAMMINQDIQRAEKALAGGDPIEMMESLKRLNAIKF